MQGLGGGVGWGVWRKRTRALTSAPGSRSSIFPSFVGFSSHRSQGVRGRGVCVSVCVRGTFLSVRPKSRPGNPRSPRLPPSPVINTHFSDAPLLPSCSPSPAAARLTCTACPRPLPFPRLRSSPTGIWAPASPPPTPHLFLRKEGFPHPLSKTTSSGFFTSRKSRGFALSRVLVRVILDHHHSEVLASECISFCLAKKSRELQNPRDGSLILLCRKGKSSIPSHRPPLSGDCNRGGARSRYVKIGFGVSPSSVGVWGCQADKGSKP